MGAFENNVKTTFRLMGIADWITLGNGLLGTLSIAFMIVAFDGFNSEDGNHVSESYIWMAMLLILLSVLGDLIDGPIARHYSKRRNLGSYLDLMADCISFGVAPSLLVFGMFSRWGEASPYWTMVLAIVCCWVVVCTMLRLARFQHESESNNRWFHGLASPGSAVLILSLSGLIWIQPEIVTIEFLQAEKGVNDKPLYWLILPGSFLAGALMISDRRLPKFSKGTGMNLSLFLLAAMIVATTIQITGYASSNGAMVSFLLMSTSLILISTHVLMGPKICESLVVEANSD
ncbi:MAG: CDP-alcohol phosphatidyltransferase family protein [Candidatus Thermoplasmatota archaeon]|nr:CDP-alcohol phosphatidyltransferase family protein [Candidatus Thermoplasmatota archaeon]